ncbi:alpha/beta hydrolase [Streptomyces sp. NPDC059785]|uniref:alpha/beta hydrolase n=1 Tax=unclassified Streptomyces TaxID=2593676 RepID=UPI003666625B
MPAPYAFDPELAPFAARMRPLDYADPAGARRTMRAVMSAQPPYAHLDRVRVTDRTLPVPGGPELTVRTYEPAERSGEPLPALLFPHWGGFVTGDLDTPRAFAARIADRVGALVVSPDYRLAPEHPFPAALDDCWAAFAWIAAHAAELGVDPDRIGVGGFSAGGALATATALRAHERGGPDPDPNPGPGPRVRVRVRFLYLLFPQLDDRLDSPSATEFTDTPVLDRAALRLCWGHYAGTGPAPSLAAPARTRTEDLAGLPPTFVGVCEFDPLRDEGVAFAHRLVAAGVRTELVRYRGTFHASVGIGHAAVSRRMVADQIEALRRGLLPTD